MTSKTIITICTKTLAVAAAISIITGTAIWLAIDIASFYTENQFTGKMKAYDAHLPNCIGAVFVITLSTIICKALGRLLDSE